MQVKRVYCRLSAIRSCSCLSTLTYTVSSCFYYHYYCYCCLHAGKSSLLSALGNQELPVPEHIDIYHLQREMSPSDKTALQCVMEVDEERYRLEHEAGQLTTMNSDGMIQQQQLVLLRLSRSA